MINQFPSLTKVLPRNHKLDGVQSQSAAIGSLEEPPPLRCPADASEITTKFALYGRYWMATGKHVVSLGAADLAANYFLKNLQNNNWSPLDASRFASRFGIGGADPTRNPTIPIPLIA